MALETCSCPKGRKHFLFLGEAQSKIGCEGIQAGIVPIVHVCWIFGDRENSRIGYGLLLVYDSWTRMYVTVLDAFLLRPKFLRVCYLGILQTLAIVDRKWQNVSMDFVFGLPHTQHQLETVFVTVSHLTKFCSTTNEAIAM